MVTKKTQPKQQVAKPIKQHIAEDLMKALLDKGFKFTKDLFYTQAIDWSEETGK